jgi:hypothetical protein
MHAYQTESNSADPRAIPAPFLKPLSETSCTRPARTRRARRAPIRRASLGQAASSAAPALRAAIGCRARPRRHGRARPPRRPGP